MFIIIWAILALFFHNNDGASSTKKMMKNETIESNFVYISGVRRSLKLRWRIKHRVKPTVRLCHTSDLTSISVTRLGDLLDFGPHFKAFGNN